jgi:hypothetical protein
MKLAVWKGCDLKALCSRVRTKSTGMAQRQFDQQSTTGAIANEITDS